MCGGQTVTRNSGLHVPSTLLLGSRSSFATREILRGFCQTLIWGLQLRYCWLKSSMLFKCSSQPMLLLFVTVVTVVQPGQSKQKMAKNPGKTRKTWYIFRGYFRVLPALDTRDRRGTVTARPSLLLLVGLTLATVVGEPHCCSVVTLLTLATLFS